MAEHCGDPFQYLTDKLFCPKCRVICTNLKQLLCFHSVCLPCLEEPRNTSDPYVILCPCCQQKSKLESIEDSPYIASLQNVKQIMSRKLSPLTCALCKDLGWGLGDLRQHPECWYNTQCELDVTNSLGSVKTFRFCGILIPDSWKM